MSSVAGGGGGPRGGIGRGSQFGPQVQPVQLQLHPDDAHVVGGAHSDGDGISNRYSGSRRGDRDRGRSGIKQIRQHMRRDLDEEGVQPTRPNITRPDEVLASHIQVALWELGIRVAAAGGIHVRHHRRDDQDAEGAVQEKAHHFVDARAVRAVGPAPARILLLRPKGGVRIRVAHMLD